MDSDGSCNMRTILIVLLMLISAIAILLDMEKANSPTRNLWEAAIVPGELSNSHATLTNNCASCHQPVKGVNSAACITCHADNKALLQRQPTAFHANIQSCTECHVEHQGGKRMPTSMDHNWLAKIGYGELRKLEVNFATGTLSKEEMDWLSKSLDQATVNGTHKIQETDKIPVPDAVLCSAGASCAKSTSAHSLHSGSGKEGVSLNCMVCHATKDKHLQLFGNSCAQCHVMDTWAVASFRHPSVRSTECAQCHMAPPSHSMMHFKMISRPAAGRPKAQVNQCYQCHQTSSWNDIKGIGWLKHH